MMSSSTAAPRTILPSSVCKKPRSARTRVETPIDVAVSAAAHTTAASEFTPMAFSVAYPITNENATPSTAMIAAIPPTRVMARKSVSSPISNSRMRSPSSANVFIASSFGSRIPSTDAPRRTPPTSSPSIAGWPSFTARTASPRVVIRTAAMTSSSCTMA